MDQQHHSKIMWIVGVLILVVIAIITGVIFGENLWGNKGVSAPATDTVTTRNNQTLINEATGPNAQKSTITKEQANALIKTATGPNSGGTNHTSSSQREKLIQAATGN